MVYPNGQIDSPLPLVEQEIPDFEKLFAETLPFQAEIDELNSFISKSFGSFLSQALEGQNYVTFEAELKKHLLVLEKCPEPPVALLFFTDVAKQLMQAETFFEYHCATAPLHLPLPISLSWINDQPLRIEIPNRGLRVLIQNNLIPLQYQEYHETLVQHLIKLSVIEYPETLSSKHTIIFRQLQHEYHLELSLNQIFLLFFPKTYIEVIEKHPEHDYSATINDIFSEYAFTIREVRFAGKISSKALLLESLILNDTVATLPKQLKALRPFKERMRVYLYFMLRHGVTEAGPMLSDQIVRALFQQASLILENGVDSSNDLLLQNFVYEAYTRIQARYPELATSLTIKPDKAPSSYSDFLSKKCLFQTIPRDGSFLLRDLFGPSPIEVKEVKLPPAIPAVIAPFIPQPVTRQPQPIVPFFYNLNRKLPIDYARVWAAHFNEVLLGKKPTICCLHASQKHAFVGTVFSQAIINTTHGTHLFVVPEADLPHVSSWLLNFHFTETLCTAWKVSARRRGNATVFPEFRNYFLNNYGKHHMAYGYDQILLDIAAVFDQQQVKQLCHAINFDATYLKKVIKPHLLSFEKQSHLPQMRVMLTAAFHAAMSRTYEWLSQLDHDENSFMICSKCYEIVQQCTSKAPLDSIIHSINVLFDEYETKAQETAVSKEAYFLLTMSLSHMHPQRTSIENLVAYPSQTVLERVMYFTPEHISICKNQAEVNENLAKFPNRHQILIASNATCRIEFLMQSKHPISTVCIDTQANYYGSLHFAKIGTLFCVSSPEVVTHSPKPAAPTFVLQTPAKASNKQPFKGFINQNNTCFINAGLQALFCTRMSKALLDPQFPEESLPATIKQLKGIHESDFDNKPFYSKLLKQLFSEVPDIKNGLGKFHDVVPVLEHILDKLKYPLKWDETYSALGDMQELIKSRTLRHPLFVLPIPMKAGATLQALVEEALSVEEVHDENNRWSDAMTIHEQVHPLSDYCTKHTLIEPLPDMLFLQLKRWKWDELAFDMVKDTAAIDKLESVKIGNDNYALKAVIHQNHELLHYHAEVLTNGKWYRCDDMSIEPIDKPDTANGYVFVIEKIA